MGLDRIVLVRHAQRQDTADDTWALTAAEPYNPPIAGASARAQALRCGRDLRDHIPAAGAADVMIHSSPYLRCVETAACIAAAVAEKRVTDGQTASTTASLPVRLDAVFGEWMTSDYFSDITPPPEDDSRSLYERSLRWLLAEQRGAVGSTALRPDLAWDLHRLGHAGAYGEQWPAMHSRFRAGLRALISHYDASNKPTTAVIVTHGAGCNSLLGLLTNQPLLSKVGLASCVVLERRNPTVTTWDVVYNSNDDRLSVPVLSNSNSTSSSTVSDHFSGSPDASESTPEQFYFATAPVTVDDSASHTDDPPLTLSFGGGPAAK